jgi:hypothetical protein
MSPSSKSTSTPTGSCTSPTHSTRNRASLSTAFAIVQTITRAQAFAAATHAGVGGVAQSAVQTTISAIAMPIVTARPAALAQQAHKPRRRSLARTGSARLRRWLELLELV